MNDVLSTNEKEPFDGQCFEDVSNVQYNIAYDDYFDMNDDKDTGKGAFLDNDISQNLYYNINIMDQIFPDSSDILIWDNDISGYDYNPSFCGESA